MRVREKRGRRLTTASSQRGSADPVSPSPYGDYLRHTFAVHGAQAGVPLPPQKLLGHASQMMTMRYMKHAPQPSFAADAARVAASLQSSNATAGVK